MIIKTKKITVFFGNKKSCPVSHKSDEFASFCTDRAKQHGLDKIIFQRQVHGTTGFYIDSEEKAKYIKSFDLQGDFLVTNQKKIGIGILTADCLPIIFYDAKNNAIAAVHAGWKSSLADICANTIQTMFEKFRFSPEDLSVFFGPCAKSCCYEVKPDFLDKLKGFKFKNQVIKQAQDKLFFDNVLFNKLILLDLGLMSKNMNFEHNHCTICNTEFHSYRNEGENALRQMSFVGLL